MTRWWRWILALVLCGVGGVVLGPVSTADAAPAADAGLGSVVADLGTETGYGEPGFSPDGRYYGFLAPSGDRCDVHVYDVSARRDVGLTHAHVLCDYSQVRWAAAADTLQWQVNASAGTVTAYAWDAGTGHVSVLAADAAVFIVYGISADGRYLAFTGSSQNHPAPGVDAPQYAYFSYDRTTGVSLPLSKPGVHVAFVSWSPAGHNFIAQAGGRTSYDADAGCFGSGTSCTVLPDELLVDLGAWWAKDGSAVILDAFAGSPPSVYDFTDGSLTSIPTTFGIADFSLFLGTGADRVVGYLSSGSVLWDRRTGAVSRVPGPGAPFASPDGRYLLYRGERPTTYRYRNVSTGADAPATYLGANNNFRIDGYWTKDGSSWLGIGPGRCSSLRQWSPSTNTVSLFGPPGLATCYEVPQPFESDPSPSSVSGRFAIAYKTGSGAGVGNYVVDLRRHVLLGPVRGGAGAFAPSGSDLLAVTQPQGPGPGRLLLVDPTPVPDVDDKPRWSGATPANGEPVQVAPGGQVHVQLGASDLQSTPVNLYFRWRDTAGTPIASAPLGWSCDRRRLAAGATVADCTFAPPARGWTATRYLDVWAVNYVTGAQSDTRSYRVAVTR